MSKILKSFGMAALLVALLAGTGMAGTTTTATGDVVNSATVNVLDTDIEFGDFVIGDNTVTTTDDSFIEVATNYNVVLQAAEAGDDGKMSVDANTLGAALKVGIEAFAATAIDGSAKTVSATINGGTDLDYDATFVQTVAVDDTVDDGYTITVTFTTTAAL